MSTTTNLKLFKHDNPTTNTNQFDVEKALNENWDKLDKNAGEIASKIQTLENTTNEKDTSQDTEIEVLKAENALLKSQIPSATVVGETIHLEDSSNMQCQISPIGASKQESREGYNKFNLEKWFNNAVASDCTKTLLDNGVKLDFTAGADAFVGSVADVSAVLIESVRGGLTEVEASTEYTISLSSAPKCYIGYYDESYVSLGFVKIENAKMTFTTPENCKYIFVRIGIRDSNYTTYSFTNIQIVEGTEEKPYEQHGASPSIEYEAPIESVGDNINLDDNKFERGGYGSDGSISSSLTMLRSLNYKGVTELTQYTISYKKIMETAHCNRIVYFDKDYNVLSVESSNITTFTTPENCKYVKECFYSGNPSTNITLTDIYDVKLEKGTKATQYSPYGQGSIEIYSYTQNLFDKTKTSKAIGSASGYVSTEYIPAVTGDTIVKSNTTSLFLYDKTKTQITNVGNWTNKKIEVENVAYVRCNVLETEVDTFMLVKNQDLPSEYIQGQSQTKAIYTQQPFRSIGEVKDRFVKVDGVWYEEHNINKYELTGVEHWTKHETKNNNAYYFMITNYMNDIPASTINNDFMSAILCSHFKTEVVNTFVFNDMQGAGLGTVTSAGQANFFIGTGLNGISTIEELKAWVTEQYTKGKPLTIYYALKTPILIPCTAEQVEVLESFNTYKNVTNISSDSIGELEVFYYKDLETLLGGV